MGEEGSAVALGDGFPPDDLDVGFEFEDDDEDLTIDFETIYRILDEKPPDSSEVDWLLISSFWFLSNCILIWLKLNLWVDYFFLG